MKMNLPLFLPSYFILLTCFFLLLPSHSSQLIACTGQVSIASWQLQAPHWSGPITFDFSSMSSKSWGQTSMQCPQPMHRSSSTTGRFGIIMLLIKPTSQGQVFFLTFPQNMSVRDQVIFLPCKKLSGERTRMPPCRLSDKKRLSPVMMILAFAAAEHSINLLSSGSGAAKIRSSGSYTSE